MEYNEFENELNRVIKVLDEEIIYYKSILVYLSMFICYSNISNSEDILAYITDYFQDLISDSSVEAKILASINELVIEKIESLTAFYFEGTPEFDLCVSILKKITNSSSKRLSDSYPEVARLLSISQSSVLFQSNYKTVKRKKYIGTEEYNSYLEVLKSKD